MLLSFMEIRLLKNFELIDRRNNSFSLAQVINKNKYNSLSQNKNFGHCAVSFAQNSQCVRRTMGQSPLFFTKIKDFGEELSQLYICIHIYIYIFLIEATLMQNFKKIDFEIMFQNGNCCFRHIPYVSKNLHQSSFHL